MKKSREKTSFSTLEPIKCPVCVLTEVKECTICEFCNWQHDLVQFSKPNLRGGANHMSLSEAQEAWKKGEPIE